MSIIPDILYHGTTLLRWNMIKSDGGFIPYHSTGLTYFTDDIDEASMFAADIRYVQDMGLYRKYPDLKWIRDEYLQKPHLRDGVIIAVDTSHLDKQRFEMDQEDPFVDKPYRKKYSIWLGYRGNISLLHIIGHKIFKLSDWDRRRQDIEEFIAYQEDNEYRRLLEDMYAYDLGAFNNYTPLAR